MIGAGERWGARARTDRRWAIAVGVFALLLSGSGAAVAGTARPHASGPPQFLVTVPETGLPANEPWTLLFTSNTDHGSHFTSTNSSFSRLEPPGLTTVVLLITGVYEPNESSHQFQVINHALTWNVTFVKNNSAIMYDNNTTTGPTTATLTTSELEFLGVVGALAVVASFIAYRSRRSRPAKPRADPVAKTAKRPKAEDDDDAPLDASAAERRRARRERREGVRPDRARGRKAVAAPADAAADDAPTEDDE